MGFQDALLPKMDDNIKCGNSLIGSDFISDDFFGMSERERHKINPFDWEVAFPFLKMTGGFDAVIGNPPYGAELHFDTIRFLSEKYQVGTTDTAALFMITATRKIKTNGFVGFIIPKPFTYASNWKKVRQSLLSDINKIVDCSKVWKEVKLEMTVYISQKGSNSKIFSSGIIKKDKVLHIADIDKNLCEEFGFILNGVSQNEIEIARKIKSNGVSLNNLVTNQRGGLYQKFLNNSGDLFAMGGKQINRFGIDNRPKGMIDATINIDNKSFIKPDSILVQNIVAHIANPRPHIKIIATSIVNGDLSKYIILDTVNQLVCAEHVSSKYILGIINSKIINWYCYRFIFANAIRTMHFDSPVTERIPIPQDPNPQTQEKLIELVERMLRLHKELQTATEFDRKHIEQYISRTDKEIDALVYQLYALTPEEIRIVEGEGEIF